MARFYKDLDPELLERAALMARLPGVRRKEAAERFGISTGMLKRALDDYDSAGPSRTDLVLHAITDAGSTREGQLPDLARIASYCDYVNKDGSTAVDVQQRIDQLVDEGRLSVDGEHWSLRVDFP